MLLALAVTALASLIASPDEAPAVPPRAVATAAPGMYRVSWLGVEAPRRWQTGKPTVLLVTLRNDGTETWPDAQLADPERRSGARAVRLGYRWRDDSGEKVVREDGTRADLPWPLDPGESVTLRLRVTAPEQAGRYQLQLDLVHEMVAWFENRGARRLSLLVKVEA
jgi:hypothetical protein